MNFPRIGRATWIWAVLSLVVSMLVAGCSAPPPKISTSPPKTTDAPANQRAPAFGTLLPVREVASQEARAGVTAAVVELGWRRFEPVDGEFDEDFIRSIRREIDGLRAAGRTITLELAIHYAPSWVFGLPDSRLVDDKGNVSGGPNMIFNQRVRSAVEDYVRHVAAGVDLDKVAAIRLSAGYSGEVVYPGNGHYWAFDRNAQNGPELPASMARNPLPGWRPETVRLTPQQVDGWADWYVGALDDVVAWQIDLWTRLGYRHAFEVLTPGQGARPQQYQEAVEQGLPPGALGSGGAWHLFYARLPRDPRIVAYVSSVADKSGRNDSCEPGDDSVPLEAPDVADWSATRWVSRVARANGFAVSGENPGWGQPGSFGDYYQDLSPRGMLGSAIRQARSCRFSTFYWAHDRQLWDGTVPFQAFADSIAR